MAAWPNLRWNSSSEVRLTSSPADTCAAGPARPARRLGKHSVTPRLSLRHAGRRTYYDGIQHRRREAVGPSSFAHSHLDPAGPRALGVPRFWIYRPLRTAGDRTLWFGLHMRTLALLQPLRLLRPQRRTERNGRARGILRRGMPVELRRCVCGQLRWFESRDRDAHGRRRFCAQCRRLHRRRRYPPPQWRMSTGSGSSSTASTSPTPAPATRTPTMFRATSRMPAPTLLW